MLLTSALGRAKPGFRTPKKQRAKADPSQNVHVERGPAITLEEVRAHALDGHASCRSTPGLAKDGKPCTCATKRFFRAHPEIVVDDKGFAWWPKVRRVVGPEPSMSVEVEKPSANLVVLAEGDAPRQAPRLVDAGGVEIVRAHELTRSEPPSGDLSTALQEGRADFGILEDIGTKDGLP